MTPSWTGVEPGLVRRHHAGHGRLRHREPGLLPCSSRRSRTPTCARSRPLTPKLHAGLRPTATWPAALAVRLTALSPLPLISAYKTESPCADSHPGGLPTTGVQRLLRGGDAGAAGADGGQRPRRPRGERAVLEAAGCVGGLCPASRARRDSAGQSRQAGASGGPRAPRRQQRYDTRGTCPFPSNFLTLS